MLMRSDPFRELDELWRRAGTGAGLAGMPMDAYRSGNELVAEFDLPGIDPDTVELSVERNVLQVSATRNAPFRDGDEVLVSERSFGTVRRQLFLGDTLDGEHVTASYEAGVLTVRIPVAEQARPQKIAIQAGGGAKAVESGNAA